MADLPIINRTDLSKVPQSIKDATNDVVFYKQLAPYLFRYNIIYKANDVFVVDNDLGLRATGLIRIANDGHIPADIMLEDVKPTYTVDPATPSATVPISSGRYIENTKTIGTFIGGPPNSIQAFSGGITWITLASGTAWGNHTRAFDTGSTAAPVIAGVQAFTGGNGAATIGYTNIYYLGSSRVTYPLYAASMAFRALGYNCKGLSVNITNDGFLQIAGGTINDWYGEEIRVPQRSKAAFYYTHGQTILNSPVLLVTITDLKRKDVNGTITPLTTANENAWHFIYMDPRTFNIYIVLWASTNEAVIGNAREFRSSIAKVFDAHSKTVIPDFLRENGILLASINVNTVDTQITGIFINQLHNFVPGNGNNLHPSIPDPNDYPEGGTLKAKDNVFQVLYNYDAYLISQATALKENHFFIYDKNIPKNILSIEYQGSKAPFTKILGLGTAPQRYDYGYPDDYWVYQYSWLDRANYPDANEKGLYSGSYRVDYPAGNSPRTDAQVRALGGMTTIDVDVDHYIPVFFNAIVLTRQAADYTYSTMSGCPKIPGINNGTMNENGVFRYDSALRAKRATQGSADSLLMLEPTSGVYIYPDEQLNGILTTIGQPRDLDIIRQLVTLIGPSLAQQIKDTAALIKQAGMFGVGRTRVMTIVGYVINNISEKNSLEYSLPGVMGLLINKNTGVVTLDPKYPIWIQPADIFNLNVDNVTPLQAVIIFLFARFNYMSYIFGGLSNLRFTEMPLPTT